MASGVDGVALCGIWHLFLLSQPVKCPLESAKYRRPFPPSQALYVRLLKKTIFLTGA